MPYEVTTIGDLGAAVADIRVCVFPGVGTSRHLRGTCFRAQSSRAMAIEYARRLARALDMWPPSYSWFIEAGPLAGEPLPLARGAEPVDVTIEPTSRGVRF